MRKDCVLLVFLIFIFADFCEAETLNGSFDIPFLGSIEVDGDLSDWNDRGFEIKFLADQNGNSRDKTDFHTQCYLGWNDQGLLVAVTVHDDEFVENDNPRRLFLGDSIELFLTRQIGEHQYYMFAISPGMTNQHKNIRHIFFDERKYTQDNNGCINKKLWADVDRIKIAGGYQMELLLPWSNIGISPSENMSLGFQLYAMDKDFGDDVENFTWHPNHDTHKNNYESFYKLVLKSKPSNDFDIFIRGVHRNISILADKSYCGKTASIFYKNEHIASQALVDVNGYAFANIIIPIDWVMHKNASNFIVKIDNNIVGIVERLGTDKWLNRAIYEGKLRFRQNVFSENKFPEIGFIYPEVVKQIIGDYELRVKYYNESFQAIETAEKAGRYGAIVEVISKSGLSRKCFFSLYRTRQDETVRRIIIDQCILRKKPNNKLINNSNENVIDNLIDRISSDEEDENFLNEKGAIERIKEHYGEEEERKWWIRFKRKLYSITSDPIIPYPDKNNDSPAPILIETTPEEAGLNSVIIQDIDSICQQLLKVNHGKGFSICIHRNGRAFFYRAYGKMQDGRVMKTDMPVCIQSVTKVFTGILFMMYVDHGYIDLDKPFEEYIPTLNRYDINRGSLTLRELASHASGIEGHSGDNMHDLEEEIASSYPYIKGPMEYLYSGKAFALGVKALELMSNEHYRILYDKLIFQPLDIKNIQIKSTHNGIICTSWDLAKIGLLYLTGGAYGDYRLMRQNTIDKAKPFRWISSGKGVMGIGVQSLMFNNDSMLAYGHNTGNSSCLCINPNNNTVISITSTEDRIYMADLLYRLTNAIDSNIKSHNQ